MAFIFGGNAPHATMADAAAARERHAAAIGPGALMENAAYMTPAMGVGSLVADMLNRQKEKRAARQQNEFANAALSQMGFGGKYMPGLDATNLTLDQKFDLFDTGRDLYAQDRSHGQAVARTKLAADLAASAVARKMAANRKALEDDGGVWSTGDTRSALGLDPNAASEAERAIAAFSSVIGRDPTPKEREGIAKSLLGIETPPLTPAQLAVAQRSAELGFTTDPATGGQIRTDDLLLRTGGAESDIGKAILAERKKAAEAASKASEKESALEFRDLKKQELVNQAFDHLLGPDGTGEGGSVKWTTTGPWLLRRVPNMPGTQDGAHGFLDQLKESLAFSELQAMRGKGLSLGALSESERAAVSQSIANLEIGGDPAELRQTLRSLRDMLYDPQLDRKMTDALGGSQRDPEGADLQEEEIGRAFYGE